MELNGYEDFEVIGSGGNAHVYRAIEVDSGETVAVKVLRGGGDESVTRRFERERTLMAELETITNVVPIHHAGFSETGDPYLIMPLYTGGSLEDKVNSGPMPWEEAVDLARMLTESIALAHAKRILHLDVKPANVLLDDDGEPWLSDFGIAEMMGHTASMSAQMMTPAFTPPERFDGAKPDEATDLYGLMATLYALLAGRPPYVTSDMTGPMAVMLAIMRDPLPLDELPDDVPESVRNLLRRGMAKNPAERPRSAIQLVGLLEDALDGRPIAPPVTAEDTDEVPMVPVVAEAAMVTSDVVAPDTSGTILRPQPVSQELLPAVPVEEEPRRRVAVLAGVLLLLLVGGGALAAMVLSGDDPDTEVAAEQDATDDVDEPDAPSASTVDPSSNAPADGGDETSATDVGQVEADDQLAEVDDTATDADDAAETESSQGVLGASVTAAPPTTAGEPSEPTTPTSAQPTTSTTAAETTTTSSTTTSSSSSTSSSTSSSSTTVAPQLEAGFVAQGGETGSEQTISFRSITVGDATSFSWDFGDGSRGTGERVTHTYAAPGTYSVTITASGGGITDSATHSVRVDPNTPELEAGFRASPGPAGAEQTISFANITVGEVTSWRWDFGDGSSSTERAPTHRYASPGTYSVTLTATGPDGSDSARHTVRVDPDATDFEAGWTASAGASPNQQTITFRSITIGDADAFIWDFGDGSEASGATVSHAYAEPGTYTVTLTASGPGGTDTATHSVRVDANA